MTPVATMDDATALVAAVRAADTVFYEHGVAGTGMAEIRDASGVSLRRLYSLYPSKRDLVAAWLSDRHRTWMAWLELEVTTRSDAGVPAILAVFDAIAEWSRTSGYRGCAFVNTAAEVAEIGDVQREIIATHKRALIGYLAELAERNGFRDPARLGQILAVLVDGAIVEAAVLSSDGPVLAARDAALRLLEVG